MNARILAIALVLMILLAACGNSASAIPNASRIQTELGEHSRSIVPATQAIDRIEIISNETDTEAGWHQALVTVFSNDADIAYISHMQVTYQRNADNEWILADITADRSMPWISSPLVGASEETIRSAIIGLEVRVDDNDWRFDEEIIESVTIVSQETQLENNRDNVIVSVELGAEAQIAQGQIELQFAFDDGWSRSSYQGHTPFVSEYRPNAIFETTGEQILYETTQRTMPFGSGNAAQDITLSSEEISNFTLIGSTSSNRGATRIYDYSFTLEKGIVVFDVNAQATYQFDRMNGWLLEVISFDPAVISVDLAGTRWIGTHESRTISGASTRQLTLEIEAMPNQGAISATLNSSPPAYSQRSTGFVDFNTLGVQLLFDGYIVSPGSLLNLNQINLYGYIDVNNSTFASLPGIQRGNHNRFEVALELQ